MALTSVRAQLAGTWYDLAYNPDSGLYEAVLTAPATPGEQVLSIRAVNAAGYQAEKRAPLDIKWEVVPPVAAITAPASGAWSTDARQGIAFTLRDEAGGSGVDLSTLELTLDGAALGPQEPGLACTAVTGGYDCVYTPPAPLPEGAHRVSVDVCDVAGNRAAPAAVGWSIDTEPPALVLAAPADGLITNVPMLTLSGTASDAASGLSALQVNGEAIRVENGIFSHTLTLAEGTNDLLVTATDAVGHQSTVRCSVLLDTVPPAFASVHMTPDRTAAPLGSAFLVTAELAESPVHPKSGETVTGTVNGVPLTLAEGPALTWTAHIPRAAGDVYALELLAADAAGNKTAYRALVPCGMECKWDWAPTDYLNCGDLNRIERNTQYLHQWLLERGYSAQVPPGKTGWNEADIPLRRDIDRIRHSVDALQAAFVRLPGWRAVVYSGTVDDHQLNALEWNLHLLDLWLARLVSAPVYAGELYAGEYP